MTDLRAELALEEVALLRRLYQLRFAPFQEDSWRYVEPTRALRPSVAVDGIVAAMEAVARGRIKRLGICTPPGVSKSKVVSVQFPAWLELITDGRARVMSGSYSHDLATRDSIATRDLVNSPWFRALVRDRWSVRNDVGNKADDWSTTASGRRIAVSTGSATTGDRATIQLLDDLLSAKEAWSEAKRRDARQWLAEVLPSRLEDTENDPRVLIGQRLHIDDPLSVAIEQGWRMLVLPAVLGPCPELGIDSETEPCVLLDDEGREVWRDPRKPGEPLVDLLGIEALVRLKRELGSAAFAAQYLQAPQDDSASMFPRAWFTRRWTELPRFDRQVITLDSSFRESKSADYAVIQVWGAHGGDRYLLEQWRRQAGFVDTLNALVETARRYPYAKILVEARANGDAVLDAIRRVIPGAVGVEPDGGKVARAASVQAIAESGAIVLPANAPWVDGWIDEMATFPGKRDDQVDATVYALRDLQGEVNDVLENMRAANANLAAFFGEGPRQPDPAAEAEQRAEADAARARRREKLDRIEAKRDRGEKLSRGELLHLRMWGRRKQAQPTTEQAEGKPAEPEQATRTP